MISYAMGLLLFARLILILLCLFPLFFPLWTLLVFAADDSFSLTLFCHSKHVIYTARDDPMDISLLLHRTSA